MNSHELAHKREVDFMLTKHLVTKDLVDKAHEMFAVIFPDEHLYDEDGGVLKSCFSESCSDDHDPNDLWNYYLWKLSTFDNPDGEFIGMSGIYTEAIDPESAWLGWIGVMPSYRRERVATRMLNSFCQECRERGFKYARLYTNENNIPAREFYKFNGFTEEKYNGPTPDCVLTGGPIYIYSKSLYPQYECPPWADRHLDF